MDPAITPAKSKAKFVGIRSQITGNQNEIINQSLDSAALDGTMPQRRFMLFHSLGAEMSGLL